VKKSATGLAGLDVLGGAGMIEERFNTVAVDLDVSVQDRN
jgi:hypothetical protein